MTIVARGLEKRFGRTVGLDGIDLEIPSGTALAILGPNGAGKSTLLRLAAGLARPTAGSLRVCGDLAHSRGARARVGFIGHATGLYPELTARENLIFASRLHRVSEPGRRADELLAAEGLGRAANRRVRGFSHGMAQRVAIAVGLVHDPEIVLLDEPFTGLDQRASDRLRERLAELHRRGCTLLLVTHDVGVAAQLADAAIVLRRGRIIHSQAGEALEPTTLEAAYSSAFDGQPI